MKSAELLRKIKKVARRRGQQLVTESGKGSHMHLSLGGRHTILPMHQAELPTGTFKGILKDLGIEEEEL